MGLQKKGLSLDKKEYESLQGVASRFMNFTDDFSCYFNAYRHNVGKHARNYLMLRPRSETVTDATVAESITPDEWSTVTVRESTKGTLRLHAYRQEVYTWNGEEKQARKWWLVLTVDPNTHEKKYLLCDAEESVFLKTMVQKHACRFWIERSFQDGKTSVRMGDYQVRGWLGWHHHMAMVMLGSLFILKERLLHNKSVNLLSCQDIVELLNYYLPRRDRSEQEVFDAMI